ncbi:Uncharacterized protein FWK35_00016244 [Aphis craccivora]|uniref:Uncharacterized protein n=1 Tax=Aphis craccivora TaxID=307492 RepID=A0A6G0YGF7_APHCR|nr:Uncharacterized protein FWK35_00016244 [Aphis craccivora]
MSHSYYMLGLREICFGGRGLQPLNSPHLDSTYYTIYSFLFILQEDNGPPLNIFEKMIASSEYGNCIGLPSLSTYTCPEPYKLIIVCIVKSHVVLTSFLELKKDSERSDECIDFIMLCVFFFVSVYMRKCRNNASISNYGGGFL